MQFLTMKYQSQQSNPVKHKDTYMILTWNEQLLKLCGWGSISNYKILQSQKRDREPTPKSLIYQLHNLVMQCEEQEVFLQYKQIREEQRAKQFAFHFVPSTIWLFCNRHTKGVRRRMEMFLYRNLNADNTQNCSDIKITHSTFSCLSSVLSTAQNAI